MNRKDFLSAVLPVAAVSTAFAPNPEIFKKNDPVRHPPFLKKGDTIGITCPSGFITAADCQSAIYTLQEWGFKVQIGNTIGAKDFTMAGTDQERYLDLQRMLDDPNLRAIMLGRGGYGAVRIIDKLDFTRFSMNPKWIIGFSDATVFHSHINRNFGISTIHSKMCNSFPDDFNTADQVQKDTIDSIRKCLTGEKMHYTALPHKNNRQGEAKGILIGGNLSLIDNLCGSVSDINTSGKILFLEDVGERLYRLDGMLWNIKRSGKLKNLKGLIIGNFRIKPDNAEDEFGKTLYEIVMEKVREYAYPVCFDFPVGHVRENYALKCGMLHRLVVKSDTIELTDE